MQISCKPESFMDFFAGTGGQNYMMRSEKRPGQYGSPKKRGRCPRRRHVFYAILTLLVSVLLWPAGMIMLWIRRLRWGFSLKCLVSLATLVAFCSWIYAGLTMPIEDVTFQRIQAGAQAALTKSVDTIADAGDIIANTSADVWTDIVTFNTGIADYSKGILADGIEYSAFFADDAKTFIVETADNITVRISSLFDSSENQTEEVDSPAESTEPSPAATITIKPSPVPEVSPSPEATSSEQPTATVSAPASIAPPSSVTPAAPSASAEETTASPEPAVISVDETPEPSATVIVISAPSVKPTVVASVTPAIAPSPSVTPEVTQTVTPVPSPTASPTAKPTLVPSPSEAVEPAGTLAIEPDMTPLPTLKPAGDAIVYHTSTGKSYHFAESCIGMSGAKPYTLAESVSDGFGSCGNCLPPKPAVLEKENVFWCDEDKVCHTSDECKSFAGAWSLITLEDAQAEEYTGCAECGAAGYFGVDILEVTPSPVPVIEPSVTLKPASDAVVYHSTNGRWYHSQENCQSMRGADPDSFSNSIALGLMWCRRCEPPKPELLEMDVLWSDEAGVAHTSDECDAFSGKYLLITLEDAPESDLIACTACHADEYLSGAVIAEATVTPNVASTPAASPAAVDETALRKLAEETIVHYSSISKYYHKNKTCVGMSSSAEHTLAEALDAGLKRCGACNPPTLEDLKAAN